MTPRRGYAIYLCGVPTDERIVPNAQCPNAENHTPEPPGYMQWIDWAEEMSQTHRRVQCDGCGTWSIWKPRGDAA